LSPFTSLKTVGGTIDEAQGLYQGGIPKMRGCIGLSSRLSFCTHHKQFVRQEKVKNKNFPLKKCNKTKKNSSHGKAKNKIIHKNM